MTCPTSEAVAQKVFSKMTEAAGAANNAEKGAKKGLRNVEEQEKILVERAGEGMQITGEGVKLYREMVRDAFKQCKAAKAAYQTFGTACLSTIGLGSKLPLAKFERKISSDAKVKCKFCEIVFDRFAKASEHMLRVHHEEIGVDLVTECAGNGKESSRGKQDANGYHCSTCSLSFNNAEACISHEPICSGDPSTRKCRKCGKILILKKYKDHTRYCK